MGGAYYGKVPSVCPFVPCGPRLTTEGTETGAEKCNRFILVLYPIDSENFSEITQREREREREHHIISFIIGITNHVQLSSLSLQELRCRRHRKKRVSRHGLVTHFQPTAQHENYLSAWTAEMYQFQYRIKFSGQKLNTEMRLSTDAFPHLCCNARFVHTFVTCRTNKHSTYLFTHSLTYLYVTCIFSDFHETNRNGPQ